MEQEEDRTKVIIDEIRYWKEHKLLSEKQCDFLLALYTRGNPVENRTESNVKSDVYLYIRFILLALMLPVAFSIGYFSNLSILIVLAVFVCFCLFAYYSVPLFKKSHLFYYYFSLFVLLGLILLASSFLVLNFTTNTVVLFTVIFLNFIGWYVVGHIKRLKFLIYSSILSALLLFMYVLY